MSDTQFLPAVSQDPLRAETLERARAATVWLLVLRMGVVIAILTAILGVLAGSTDVNIFASIEVLTQLLDAEFRDEVLQAARKYNALP